MPSPRSRTVPKPCLAKSRIMVCKPGHLIVGAWDVVIHDHKDVPGIEAGTSLHFVKEVNGQWPGSVCCHNYVNGGVDRLTGADCPPGMCRKHFFNKSLSSHVGLRP